MSTTVKIRNTIVGEGLPKICVPIVGKTREEILTQAERILPHDPDLVEWRLDYVMKVSELPYVLACATDLRKCIGDLPILATFRTRSEGGEREITDKDYNALYRALIDSGLIDAIDVEVFQEQMTVTSLVSYAKENGITVIGSSHDFQKTPPKEEIVRRLCLMQTLNMDAAKVAVMPETTSDLLTLLDATLTMKEEHPSTPVITMSMSGKGVLSRLAGGIFGSALTFATVGKESAPGQVPIEELRIFLQKLNDFS